MKKSIVILLIAIMGVSFMATMNAKVNPLLSKEEIYKVHDSLFRTYNRVPLPFNEFFHHSVQCAGCHGYDSTGFASTDGAGNDVNLVDDWKTSMMALSAIDPLWRAKVSHEGQVNPGHATALENTCTKCHAPMGHYTARFKGLAPYTIANLVTDSLGLDGVSCSGCHMIDSTVGLTFSGEIPFDTIHRGTNGYRTEYGPFQNPVAANMQLYVGITPTFSTHVSEGRMCSSCHTLVTNTADLSGNLTGGTFVEQATYHEWLNSSYPSMDITCQKCHMPQLEDPIVLYNELGMIGRAPFNLHFFQGANAFMVDLIKRNKQKLGLNHLADIHFENTIAAIEDMMTNSTLDLDIIGTPYAAQDSLYIDLSLLNKAGHKFPSGYPSRRAFVQMIVIKSNGDTLFRSGLMQPNGEIMHNTGPYQNHYSMINQETQTQIYEMIMGDVMGDRTTVLERAALHLKDNRIPPLGFTTTHSAYDTIQIVGNASSDTNFNRNGATEGTGKDILHYHIPLNGFMGEVSIYTKVYYQTVNPGWLNEMFAYNTPAIDSFRNWYNQSDQTPLLVARDSLLQLALNVSVQDNLSNHIQVYPNPISDGIIRIENQGIVIQSLSIYDLTGRLIGTYSGQEIKALNNLQLPSSSGTYILKINTEEGQLTKKVIRY
ncbi:MAG TPA: hypothetical protein DEP18_01365 [Flavobacteriales bacterium]|nr:hypothetical protein [Flavobacteriales bacterium]HCA82406.1 hypothetical protein [Flavobacteriales bacterium]HRE74964.1 T9SS type A sorting domain-containing protein [Flavobacteriales bacterium]HRJ38076.1 T9SS type A sorting domain-containing protein [Flavobacteriales bacterium]